MRYKDVDAFAGFSSAELRPTGANRYKRHDPKLFDERNSVLPSAGKLLHLPCGRSATVGQVRQYFSYESLRLVSTGFFQRLSHPGLDRTHPDPPNHCMQRMVQSGCQFFERRTLVC